MWTRENLKNNAKVAFKRNYWRCVLIAFILLLIAGGSRVNEVRNQLSSNDTSAESVVNSMIEDARGDDDTFSEDDIYNSDSDIWDDNSDDTLNFITDDSDSDTNLAGAVPGMFAALLGIGVGVFALVGIALSVFIFNPLEVGGCRFFTENATSEDTPVDRILHAFKSGSYLNVVLTMFLKGLFTILWSLLLFIPGIIKSYEYRMIPYLLAENPEMSHQEAFRISKEMMSGEKWNAFVLDLSFFGWALLSAITLGLAGVFYVNPYQNATNAELYLELKRQHQYQL